MRITIKQSDFELMVSHAKAGLPNEVCGLIAGKLEDGDAVIEKYICFPTLTRAPSIFPSTLPSSWKQSKICEN